MPIKHPHPLYSVWQGMRRRCLTPTYRQWEDYGGRGISICPEWESFDRFISDMGPRPNGYSLDRINNDEGYSPSNCRWATRKEQVRNRRGAVFVMIGETQHRAIELAEASGLKVDTIVQRANEGLPFELVVSTSKVRDRGTWRTAVAARVAKQMNATHCKHGHEWNIKNTARTKTGAKTCRECARLKEQRRRLTARSC